MQYTPADDRHASSSPTRRLRLSRTRIGYTLAGAFAFVGTAAALHAATTPSGSMSGADSLTLHQTTSQAAPASSAGIGGQADSSSNHPSSSVHASVSASGNSAPDVQLHVNGQNIPIPANGTTQQTVTNTNGSQTSVNASSNISAEGNASNSSTTTFSLNVTSHSSTGGTIPQTSSP